MLTTDMLLILGLLTFVMAWFARGRAWRSRALWLSAVIAAVAALVGISTGRWQAVPGLALALLFLSILAISAFRAGTAKLPVKRERKRLPWLSGPLFLLLTLAAAWPLYVFPIFDLPAPGGPHAVGVRDFELTDPSRRGLQEAAPDEPRRLRVRVWYPAADVSGMEPRPYFSRQEVEDVATSAARNFGLPSYFFTHLGRVGTHSYEDAGPADGSDWPVVFFSHGYSSHLGQSTALMERLASHGYLVYSVQHSYDSATVRFDDGSSATMGEEWFEWLERMREQGPSGSQLRQFVGPDYEARYQGTLDELRSAKEADSRLYRSVAIWRDDRLFLLQQVAARQVPEQVAAIVAKGNYRKVGHLGMSFGGSTAASVCQADPRCGAAVNMDGGNFDATQVNRDQPAPFLMFQHDWQNAMASAFPEGLHPEPDYGYNDFSYERFSQAGMRADVYRLVVRDTTHLGISDMGLMLRQPLRGLLFGDLPGEENVAIQNDVIQGFLDKHLRGKANGFPEEIYAAHPAIVPQRATGVRDWWRNRPTEQ